MPDPYRNSASVLVRGYYGKIEYPAFSRNLVLSDIWKVVEKIGGAAGTYAYLSDTDDESRILLKYVTAYPAEINTKTKWAQTKGNAADFESIPAAGFTASDDATAGLMHRNGAVDAESEFVSGSAIISKNGAHSVHVMVMKPANEYAVWFYRWGEGDARWSFEIINGQARVVRLLPTWTDFDEGALWILKAIESPTTEQREQIATYEAQLYADEQSISLSSGEEWYAMNHEVSFVPGPKGVFGVTVEGGETQDVLNTAHAALYESRGPADTRIIPAWPLSKATIGSNGGAYGWRSGRPEFNTTGTVRFGTFPAPLGIDASDITVTPRYIANGGTVTAQCVARSVAFYEIVITMTGSGLNSPVLLGATAWAPAGDRLGSDTVVLNTANEPDLKIMDVRPTFEKDGRRTMVEVEIRNVGGAAVVGSVFPGAENTGGGYNLMHDRLADVIVNDTALVRRSLITRAMATNVRGADLQDMIAQGYGQGDSKIVLSLADWWFIVDQMRIKHPPALAGARVGYALRSLLNLAGFKSSDMSGVSAVAGIRLPNDFKVEANDNLGDKLRHIVKLFGHGAILQCRQGVWNYGPRSTTVKATFQRGGDVGLTERLQAEPVMRIFDQADVTRDFTDFFNKWTVIGGKDANGNPIVRSATNWISTGYNQLGEPISGASNSPYFVGRVIEHESIYEESLKSVGAVNMALMSVKELTGKPGCFFEWASWWIDNVLPGDRVEVDGGNYDEERLCDGSVARDRMRFSGRQVF